MEWKWLVLCLALTAALPSFSFLQQLNPAASNSTDLATDTDETESIPGPNQFKITLMPSSELFSPPANINLNARN